ncbi:hypothetical protein OUZ56_007864 [Daphnia magna]|uniref:Uncharacterized protein n=1 Tax=Daphnia magna TaxID=35525 RepID=A0ABR0AB80_9CRUS|nr:hypothetical protein OUZ56_007864 [Daphnia magna]
MQSGLYGYSIKRTPQTTCANESDQGRFFQSTKPAARSSHSRKETTVERKIIPPWLKTGTISSISFA